MREGSKGAATVINDADAAISAFYSMTPNRYPVMKSITLTQGFDRATGEMQQQVSLVLAKDESFGGEMLHIELLDVRNLRFEQPSFSLIAIPAVRIEKAPPGGRFDRRFVVLSGEQDLQFVCSCGDFVTATA
jgi:hypothetical protein